MAVTQANKSAKAHDGIGYATRHLVDDEVINLTDILSTCPIDLGSLNVFARDALMIRMGCRTGHGFLPQ
jgi:hypothetical protein